MRITEYEFAEEPAGELYRRLVDYMGTRAHSFSLALVRPEFKNPNRLRILDRLKPFQLRLEQTRKWGDTVLAPRHTAFLIGYRVAPESLAILRDEASGLYAWHAPDYPDDLSFYRSDRTPLLSSTAHEKEARLTLTSDEHADVVATIPQLVLKRVLAN